MAGLFLFWEFFKDLGSVGLQSAFNNLAEGILACELAINRNVNLALENSARYGVNEFLEIITSIFILYTLFLFLIKLFKFSMTKDVALLGSILVSAIIIGVIEMSVLKMMGHEGFIPFVDGIVFFALNTGPVFNNIF